MNKEIIIICESIYNGNTLKLAKAMAYKLNCMVISAEEALARDLSKYKTIGLGSGIYFTSHHPKLCKVAEKISGTQSAFIFSTRGRPYQGDYHKALKSIIERNGVNIIGEFSTKGFDCTGPYIIVSGGNKGRPNEKDENKAMAFIKKILPEYVKDLNSVPHGNVYINSTSCSGCGRCVARCPLNVFSIIDNKAIVVKEEDCIHCGLCQKNCASQSIFIKHNFYEAIAIAKHHSKRKSL